MSEDTHGHVDHHHQGHHDGHGEEMAKVMESISHMDEPSSIQHIIQVGSEITAISSNLRPRQNHPMFSQSVCDAHIVGAIINLNIDPVSFWGRHCASDNNIENQNNFIISEGGKITCAKYYSPQLQADRAVTNILSLSFLEHQRRNETIFFGSQDKTGKKQVQQKDLQHCTHADSSNRKTDKLGGR